MITGELHDGKTRIDQFENDLRQHAANNNSCKRDLSPESYPSGYKPGRFCTDGVPE